MEEKETEEKNRQTKAIIKTLRPTFRVDGWRQNLLLYFKNNCPTFFRNRTKNTNVRDTPTFYLQRKMSDACIKVYEEQSKSRP